ncbi:hypothetical protein PCE1_003498 [Barthelona sp. PCE]
MDEPLLYRMPRTQTQLFTPLKAPHDDETLKFTAALIYEFDENEGQRILVSSGAVGDRVKRLKFLAIASSFQDHNSDWGLFKWENEFGLTVFEQRYDESARRKRAMRSVVVFSHSTFHLLKSVDQSLNILKHCWEMSKEEMQTAVDMRVEPIVTNNQKIHFNHLFSLPPPKFNVDPGLLVALSMLGLRSLVIIPRHLPTQHYIAMLHPIHCLFPDSTLFMVGVDQTEALMLMPAFLACTADVIMVELAKPDVVFIDGEMQLLSPRAKELVAEGGTYATVPTFLRAFETFANEDIYTVPLPPFTHRGVENIVAKYKLDLHRAKNCCFCC